MTPWLHCWRVCSCVVLWPFEDVIQTDLWISSLSVSSSLWVGFLGWLYHFPILGAFSVYLWYAFFGEIIRLYLEPSVLFFSRAFDKSSWEIHHNEFKNFQAVTHPWALNTLAQMVFRFFNSSKDCPSGLGLIIFLFSLNRITFFLLNTNLLFKVTSSVMTSLLIRPSLE